MTAEDTDCTRLSLNQLWVFTHVARTSSITQSTDVLFRAQPAITRNIQKLESTLRERLFERRPSGMLLTPVGNCVLLRASRVFAELETLNHWCSEQGGRKFVRGTMPTYLLNTRRLELLIALAGSLHMPTAARSAGVTQAAVSAAIKVLETGSGMQLFQRSGRGIEQTAEGREFVLRAGLAINELNLISEDISAFKGNLHGKVIVGITPCARTMIFPKAIARLNKRFPGIRIRTEETPYEHLNSELRAGNIDFVLTSMNSGHDYIWQVSEQVLLDSLIVAARGGHPLASRSNLTLADIQSEQWIFPHIHAPTRSVVEAMFTQENLTVPVPVLESSDAAVLRGTLGNTDMLAALSARQLHPDLVSGELVVLDIKLPNTQRPIGIRRRQGQPSPAARVLMDIIKEVADELG
jgi:LysR family transcriptional regulator of gallate degradation